MINLFDRVYIKHDNAMSRSRGQTKIIISDKEFDIQYAETPEAQRHLNILPRFTALEELDAEFGSRNDFWTVLRAKSAKALIIAKREVVAELLIQCWKSVFVNTTLDSLYTLYSLYVNNENLHANRANERQARHESPNSRKELPVRLTLEEFAPIYEKTEAVAALSILTASQLPFEYLMMSYFTTAHVPGAAGNNRHRIELFKKIGSILKQNVVAEMIAIRDDMFYETHNFYLLNEGEREELITDPMEEMRKRPELAWALDDIFEFGNEDEILKKYSLSHMKMFFMTHQKLLRYRMDEYAMIDLLISGNYDAIIQMDIDDHKGNFFCLSGFVSKINGLLISYLYQLVRMGRCDLLANYVLK